MLTALLAWAIFAKRLTWPMDAGFALVAAGVALIKFGGPHGGTSPP